MSSLYTWWYGNEETKPNNQEEKPTPSSPHVKPPSPTLSPAPPPPTPRNPEEEARQTEEAMKEARVDSEARYERYKARVAAGEITDDEMSADFISDKEDEEDYLEDIQEAACTHSKNLCIGCLYSKFTNKVRSWSNQLVEFFRGLQ